MLTLFFLPSVWRSSYHASRCAFRTCVCVCVWQLPLLPASKYGHSAICSTNCRITWWGGLLLAVLHLPDLTTRLSVCVATEEVILIIHYEFNFTTNNLSSLHHLIQFFVALMVSVIPFFPSMCCWNRKMCLVLLCGISIIIITRPLPLSSLFPVLEEGLVLKLFRIFCPSLALSNPGFSSLLLPNKDSANFISKQKCKSWRFLLPAVLLLTVSSERKRHAKRNALKAYLLKALTCWGIQSPSPVYFIQQWALWELVPLR